MRLRGRQGVALRSRVRGKPGGPRTDISRYLTGDAQQSPGFKPDHLYATRPKPVLTDPSRQATRDLPLAASDYVLGVSVGDLARAYPTDGLVIHHLINETIDTPALVTFCGRCFSGIVFDPVIDGERLLFDVAGLYEGNMALRDIQTESLWSQLTGGALVGPLVGERLRMRISDMTTFDNWLDLHPQSESPAVPPFSIGDKWDLTGSSGAATKRISHQDDRLGANSFVLGIDVPGSPTAVLMDSHERGPSVRQFEVAGFPIVLLAGRGSWPLAYDRRIDGEPVELEESDGHLVGGGSTWDYHGRATSGRFAERELSFIPSRSVHWYAWSAAYPDTLLLLPE